MSVAFILNPSYSYVENNRLNQELEVSTSIKAPTHFVQDISMSQTIDGNLSIDAPVIECIQLECGIGVFDTSISTAEIVPDDGTGGTILVDGSLDFQSAGSLLNVDKMTLGSGAPVAGYVLSASDVDGTLAWIPDAAGDVSQWSTYTAVSDVMLSSFKLDGAKTVTDDVWTNYISLPKDGTSSSMYLSSFTNTAKIPTVLVDALNTANPLGTQINVSKNLNLSSNIIYAGEGRFGTSVTSVSTFLGVEPNRWTGLDEYTLQQLDGDNAIRSESGADLAGFHDVQSKRGKFYTTDAADVEKFSANQDGQVVCEQLIPNYKPERVLWVSPNNTYATPNGSYENPYTTIQDAINYAESVYNNTYWYINVMPGTYAGFTVTKKVFIKGVAPSSPDGCSVGCQINSQINISVDSNGADMFNNQVSLSGFLITDEISCNSGNTANSMLNISDCYLYNDSGSGRSIHYNPDSADGRLLLFNNRIVNQSSGGTSPLIEVSKGMMKAAQCVCLSAGLANVLRLNGTSRVDSIVQCSFTSTNVSAVLPAIVELSGTGAVFTFSQCAFVYTSATNKSANPNSSAILCASATTQPSVIISYNSFFLAGTNGSNFVLQDNNFGNARQAIVLYFSNNASLSNASAIRGTPGVSKFSLQAVA